MILKGWLFLAFACFLYVVHLKQHITYASVCKVDEDEKKAIRLVGITIKDSAIVVDVWFVRDVKGLIVDSLFVTLDGERPALLALSHGIKEKEVFALFNDIPINDRTLNGEYHGVSFYFKNLRVKPSFHVSVHGKVADSHKSFSINKQCDYSERTQYMFRAFSHSDYSMLLIYIFSLFGVLLLMVAYFRKK